MNECKWKEDDGGLWTTECGEAHQFISEGPKENHYKFCPYCGKTIKPESEVGK